jgi:hypothetical protein
LLAENINQQVFRRFVLPAVVRYGGIALSNPEQFENLDRIVRGLIQGLQIDSVTIYDSRVNIISYSTVGELVGKRDLGGLEYKKALEGQANSRFIYSGSIFSLLSVAPAVSCHRAYIPFRQVERARRRVIMGLSEIVETSRLRQYHRPAGSHHHGFRRSVAVRSWSCGLSSPRPARSWKAGTGTSRLKKTQSNQRRPSGHHGGNGLARDQEPSRHRSEYGGDPGKTYSEGGAGQ